MTETVRPASSTAFPAVRDDATTRLWAIGFCLLILLRIVAAAVIPLTEDEAYYRLWAQHPGLGYYDHPPGVAWAIWLGVRLLGDTALGVRVVAVATGAATCLATVDLARAAGFDTATARRAGLWYVAAPLVGFGGVLALPDIFTGLCWVLCLRALVAAERRPAAWLGAGAAVGAAFLCKYSALFLGPVIAWRLLARPQGRAALLTPWPWLGLLAATSLASLNIVWNAQHHWVTFAKQFGRVGAEGLAPGHLPLFLLAFAALLNPLTLPFLWRAWTRRRRDGDGAALLWLSGAPFIAYLLLHSLHSAVQAHWPAPLYPALAILAASGARQASGGWRRVALAAPVFGLVVSSIALVHLASPWSDWLGKRDPARMLRGWPAFARSLDGTRIANHANWVGMLAYAEAAQLSANWRGAAPTLQVGERRRYLFAPPPGGIAGPGIIADLDRRMPTARLEDCFAIVRPLPPLYRGDRAGQRYDLAYVDAPRRDVARDGCRTFHDGKADP